MAKTVIVRSICDRCQSEGKADVDSAEETGFSYDGYSYTLDLCGPHAEDFHNTIQMMVAWSTDRSKAPEGRARRGAPATRLADSGRGPARRDKEQIGAIRDWANANGYKVSNRGRIPAEVEVAYNAAH
ncbi:MAG: hypothetical protein QOE93_2540 [Actinomycetota bacterium]|jgi:hypothetical protein|nr:hypothetical protein [Actinomycetota bacterium]